MSDEEKITMGCATLLIFVVVAIVVTGVFLFAVNSLAAAGGSEFFIPYTFWNFVYAFLLLATLGGSSVAGSKS